MADDRPATLSDIAEIRGAMETGFSAINQRLDRMLDGFVTHPFCRERHDAQDDALASAVKSSADDRERLWKVRREDLARIESLEKAQQRLIWAVAVGAVGLIVQIVLLFVAKVL